LRFTFQSRPAALASTSIALCAAFAGAATADTVSPSPITFEPSQGYVVGDVNNQNGWTKTGGYDVAVADVGDFAAASGYGFGAQALRLSDAVTSGSFGDQTFSPGLSEPAGESGQSHFDATFQIGTTLATVQPGLHLSVSPDDGNGARMSYLRFEDQADGVHVFFDDATDPGPAGTGAVFNDTEIATLDRAHAHTIRFSINFHPGPANDVVKIYVDGTLKTTGTTWEDYYRYDPEQGGQVPAVSKLLFRESGSATTGDSGNGFLVDGVTLSSSVCMPTGYEKDGIDLTARQIGGSVTGELDATGCNIGAYFDATHPGSVNGADIHGANYFGVVVRGTSADVNESAIHDIGEVPFNGTQHGNAVVYVGGAHGTVSGNTVTRYQKNGITIRDPGTSASVLNNIVTGQGPIDYIAQNGIQISFGASATVTGNTVSGNDYTPEPVTACGLLFFQANGVKQSKNSLFDNETNLCNAGRGGGNTSG
jgi:hypothetical protein